MTIQTIGPGRSTAVFAPGAKPAIAPTGQTPGTIASAPAADPAQLEQAVQAIRKAVEPMANHLQISIDKDTGITVVKVVDSSTKEVIRQIPTEEAMSIAKSLDKLEGFLFKEEA